MVAYLMLMRVPARAYTEQALSDYKAGLGFQATRQWKAAVGAYQAALREDPSLTMAYKGLGTVYYMAGDHRGALYFYGRYLAANPGDTATRNFAEGLRASLGPAPSGPPPAVHGGPFRPGFDLRLPFTGLLASAADVDKFYSNYSAPPASSGFTATNNVPQSGLALGGVGLGLDFGLSNGFVQGFDFLYGPARAYSVSNSASYEGSNVVTQSDTYGINQYSFLLTPGWRFKAADNVVLEPRLGLGWTNANLNAAYTLSFSPEYASQFSSYAGTYSYAASGSGFLFWPEIKGEYVVGQFGVGLSLGYLYGTPIPMKYTSISGNFGTFNAFKGYTGPPPAVGAEVGYAASSTSTSATPWSLNTGGVTVGLFVTWHVQPLFW
jgi:hypothetical protein